MGGYRDELEALRHRIHVLEADHDDVGPLREETAALRRERARLEQMVEHLRERDATRWPMLAPRGWVRLTLGGLMCGLLLGLGIAHSPVPFEQQNHLAWLAFLGIGMLFAFVSAVPSDLIRTPLEHLARWRSRRTPRVRVKTDEPRRVRRAQPERAEPMPTRRGSAKRSRARKKV